MSEQLNWDRAEEHLRFTEEKIRDLSGMPGINMMFYAGVFSEIKGRYESGERTPELYERIMELH